MGLGEKKLEIVSELGHTQLAVEIFWIGTETLLEREAFAIVQHLSNR